jgi:LysM repeat protein
MDACRVIGWMHGSETPHLRITHIPTQDLENEEQFVPSTQVTQGSNSSRSGLRVITLVGVVGCAVLFAGPSSVSFLSRIADARNVSVLEDMQESVQTLAVLTATRHVDPSLGLGGGGVLVVDGVSIAKESSPFSQASNTSAPANPDQIAWYSVQEGDTLSHVAQMFGVSVNTIVWANELKSNTDIRQGQTLLILPISGVQHTIKKGDTIASLAKKYGGDEDEIRSYNNIEEDQVLIAGERITIPGGAVEEVKVATPSRTGGAVVSSGPSLSGYFIHPIPGAVRTQGIHGYNAVDFGAPVGTPIVASAGGKVIVSRVGGWNGGYGNYVVIDHPKWHTDTLCTQ